MAKAEGLYLPFDGEEKIKASILETFPYKGNKQVITYKTTEFSSVCPFSGLPDYGTLILDYIPKQKIVELKSLKYYIISYRSVGIYQEPMTNQFFNDLYTCLSPTYMKLTTIYNTRGGIDTTCVMEKGTS